MKKGFILLVFCLSTLACVQSTPTSNVKSTLPPASPTSTAKPGLTPTTEAIPPTPVSLARLPFSIAIEYAIPGLAQAYSSTHSSYAKPQPIFGMWGVIEPEPGHYNWKPLDDLVVEYQAAGFTGIQLLITVESPWASIEPPAPLRPGNTFPKEENLDEYSAFVARFVERYDGDGVDDAPGLLYPIHEYGIEREFTGFWPGTAEEYVRLLKTAYPAIHGADSQAQVLLVALLVGDVFDGNPPEDEVQRRLAKSQPFRKTYAEIKTILSACDAYDIVDFHSLGDYTEIPPTANWIRQELRTLGCQGKSMWIGDSFSMSPLVGFNGQPFHPATAANREQVIASLQTLTDPKNPAYPDNLVWLRAEIARGLVKKAVVAALEWADPNAPLLGINIGNLEDWKTNILAIDALAVPSFGTSMFMGMMDTSLTSKTTGSRLPNISKAGGPRPAFYALKLLNEKIRGFHAVEKLDVGQEVWAYRFETPAGPVWVLWRDTGTLYLPGEIPPILDIRLLFPASTAILTWTPVTVEEKQPRTETLNSIEGVLSLSLDSTPVFIQPAP